MTANLTEILNALTSGLNHVEQHKGEDGYRQPFDIALHLKVQLELCGFRITRKPSRKAVETSAAS